MNRLPFICIGALVNEYREISAHKRHPDRKPLDSGIALIAKERLGLTSPEGIQVVDDLVGPALSKRWGSSRFGVIAIHRGLSHQARRFLILTELYKASSLQPLIKLAINIGQVVFMLGIISSGGGMYVIVGKICLLAFAHSTIDKPVNGYFDTLAQHFAIKEFDEEDRKEIKATLTAFNQFSDEGMWVIDELTDKRAKNSKFLSQISEICVLLEEGWEGFSERLPLILPLMPDVIKTLELTTEKRKELLAKARELNEPDADIKKGCNEIKVILTELDEEFKSSLKPVLDLLQNTKNEPTALDLQYTLRPRAGRSNEFYSAREAYHLENLWEMNTNVFLATVGSSLGLGVYFNLSMNTMFAIGLVAPSLFNRIGYYSNDWCFSREKKLTPPEKFAEGVWRGVF